jgi:hypothetical protein
MTSGFYWKFAAMISNEFPQITQKSRVLYPQISKKLARVLLQCVQLSQLLFRRVAVPTEMTYLPGQLEAWMTCRFFWKSTLMITNVFSQISQKVAIQWYRC